MNIKYELVNLIIIWICVCCYSRVLVQILCSYVTLPLYALVTQVKILSYHLRKLLFLNEKMPYYASFLKHKYTQMGSTMKPTVFNETVAKAIRTWHHTARKHIKQKRHAGAVNVTPSSLQSQPSTPSPVQLLRYNSGDSSYAPENQRAGQIEQHSPYREAASSWSHNGENYDIMQNSEQIRNRPESEPVPQIHKFQHEVDVESSADFSFTRNPQM